MQLHSDICTKMSCKCEVFAVAFSALAGRASQGPPSLPVWYQLQDDLTSTPSYWLSAGVRLLQSVRRLENDDQSNVRNIYYFINNTSNNDPSECICCAPQGQVRAYLIPNESLFRAFPSFLSLLWHIGTFFYTTQRGPKGDQKEERGLYREDRGTEEAERERGTGGKRDDSTRDPKILTPSKITPARKTDLKGMPLSRDKRPRAVTMATHCPAEREGTLSHHIRIKKQMGEAKALRYCDPKKLRSKQTDDSSKRLAHVYSKMDSHLPLHPDI